MEYDNWTVIQDANEVLFASLWLMENEEAEDLANLLRDYCERNGILSEVQVIETDDSVWQNAWQNDDAIPLASQLFEIKRFDENPSEWATNEEPDLAQHIIWLAGGEGFGDGRHVTTRLLIRLLEALPPTQGTFLDLGCGNGVIAICAAKIGFDAFATEVEIEAFEEAKQNFKRNRVQIQAEHTDRIPDIGFDVIACNILPPLLFNLIPGMHSRLNADGIMLLTGINQSNDAEFYRLLQRFPDLKLDSVIQESGWSGVRLLKAK